MSDDEWQVAEGTGWIEIPDFGQIGPQSDLVGGGRQHFTAKTLADEYAKVTGECITGGQEYWWFEYEESFYLADYTGQVLEVMISPLQGGRYAVKYRPGEWPKQATGGWTATDC